MHLDTLSIDVWNCKLKLASSIEQEEREKKKAIGDLQKSPID